MESLRHGWAVDKRISAGHLLTTIVIVVGAIFYIARIEGRVDRLDAVMATEREARGVAIQGEREARIQSYAALVARQERSDARTIEYMRDIKVALGRIETRLDRQIERQLPSYQP